MAKFWQSSVQTTPSLRQDPLSQNVALIRKILEKNFKPATTDVFSLLMDHPDLTKLTAQMCLSANRVDLAIVALDYGAMSLKYYPGTDRINVVNPDVVTQGEYHLLGIFMTTTGRLIDVRGPGSFEKIISLRDEVLLKKTDLRMLGSMLGCVRNLREFPDNHFADFLNFLAGVVIAEGNLRIFQPSVNLRVDTIELLDAAMTGQTDSKILEKAEIIRSIRRANIKLLPDQMCNANEAPLFTKIFRIANNQVRYVLESPVSAAKKMQ